MSEYIYQSRGEPLVNERGEIYLARTGEIVRCMDCRYYDQNDKPSEVYPDRYLCDLMANFLYPDGFCAWGERRERESAEVWNQWSADDVTCSEES